MASETKSELKTYRGNCHCGAFVYEAQLPEIAGVGQCNCSICSKKGYLWVFPSSADHVKIVKGDESQLTEYQFGPKKLVHKFCPTCGSGILAKGISPGGATFGLNAHCIQGLNTWELKKKPFDGAALDPKREIPKFSGPELSAQVEGGKLYSGSCHCGAVTLALKSAPIDKTYTDRIIECNCSICERNGYVWVYPRTDQVVVQGEENLARYKFGHKILSKTFCNICGVNLTNDVAAQLSQQEVDALPDDIKSWYDRATSHRPVNLRVLDNFDIQNLNTEKLPGFTKIQPMYVNP